MSLLSRAAAAASLFLTLIALAPSASAQTPNLQVGVANDGRTVFYVDVNSNAPAETVRSAVADALPRFAWIRAGEAFLARFRDGKLMEFRKPTGQFGNDLGPGGSVLDGNAVSFGGEWWNFFGDLGNDRMIMGYNPDQCLTCVYPTGGEQ